MRASDSDITVNDGSVDFSGSSLLEFLLSTSLTINDGDFNLRDTAQMIASATSIDILGGQFRVFNQVSLDFDDVDIFIGSGNAEFSDDSQITLRNSDFHVTGGTFETRDNAALDFTDSPVLVEGSIVLNGQSHSFVRSPITVDSLNAGGFQSSGSATVTTTDSPIVINSGDMDFNDNSCLLYTSPSPRDRG